MSSKVNSAKAGGRYNYGEKESLGFNPQLSPRFFCLTIFLSPHSQSMHGLLPCSTIEHVPQNNRSWQS